jgi:signal transduction histidine kinase
LRFEVWDTGPGIPEDRLNDIFREFFQLNNPERDRARGLGLGLAIVQKGATLLGARVEVKSKIGKGSVFAIVFPSQQEAAGAGTPLP